MKQLTCDVCGGTNLLKQEGVFVCQTCGCRYSVEEVRRMLAEDSAAPSAPAPAQPDNSALIENYLKLAENALTAGNNSEAETYANKIIELKPQHAKAWFIKGKAAGWQTTGKTNRFPESILAWINAHQFASEAERDEIDAAIGEEAQKIALATLALHCNAFKGFRSEENEKDVKNTVDMIDKQMRELDQKMGLNLFTEDFKTMMARNVNTCAVEGSNAADTEFGPENRNRGRFEWNRFTSSQDRCLNLLNKAYDITNDDALCMTICKNYVAIAKSVRDSCSYSYSASLNRYIQEYSFNEQAKKLRSNTISDWEKKRDKHDPERRKSSRNAAAEAFKKSFSEEARKAAIDAYWAEHADEKRRLDQELDELTARKEQLDRQVDEHPDRIAAAGLRADIDKLTNQMNSLGIFKGKEKKELAARIDKLSSECDAHNKAFSKDRAEIDTKLRDVAKRRGEIVSTLSAYRGIGKFLPKRSLELFRDSRFAVTPLEVADYFRDVLPGDFQVKGSGEQAIENYSKTMNATVNAAAALLAALTGQKTDLTGIMDDADDPEAAKLLRINFSTPSASAIYVEFTGTTLQAPITSFGFEMSGDHAAKGVANYLKLVASTITGITPDVDVDRIVDGMLDCAYGFGAPFEVEANGHKWSVRGGTKQFLSIVIKP